MRFRKAIACLLTGVLVATLAACGRGTEPQASQEPVSSVDSSESATPATTDDDTHVAVIFKSLTAEYWKTMEAGCKKAAEELGIQVTVLGPNAESEIAQQVTQIEEQISAGVDAIVVAPCEENAVIGALSPVVGQIPVLFVDTDANLEGKTAFIGTGNENAARLGGEYAASVIGEGGNAILIGGQQGEITSAQRLDGFRKGLVENGVVILDEQFGNNTADKAMAIMEDLLTKYPGQINAVLAMNDDMAIGIQQACENSGITDICIVGFNADAGALQMIQDGKIDATVAQQPYLMGYQCVQEAYKAAQGELVEPYQDVPAELVNADTVADYLERQANLG